MVVVVLVVAMLVRLPRVLIAVLMPRVVLVVVGVALVVEMTLVVVILVVLTFILVGRLVGALAVASDRMVVLKMLRVDKVAVVEIPGVITLVVCVVGGMVEFISVTAVDAGIEVAVLVVMTLEEVVFALNVFADAVPVVVIATGGVELEMFAVGVVANAAAGVVVVL